MIFHHGDNITQIGDHNSVNKHQGSPETAFRDLFAAVDDLRDKVEPADRSVIDHSLAVIRERDASEESARQALSSIAGIAALLGSSGSQVVESVRAVNESFRRFRDAVAAGEI